jgi:hypothetical protein
MPRTTKMRHLGLLITWTILLTTLTSYSQTDSVNLRIFVTNKAENNTWFDNLVTLDKNQQIEKIKQRLLADTVALTTDSTWTVKSIQPLTVEYYCRPLLKINKDTIIIETLAQTKELISILTDTRFNKIEILNSDRAKDKYGKWGLCGVIQLTTKDKKVNSRIKKIGH